MRALICGHTGATGKIVLEALVNADWVESVVTVGRRNYEKYENHPKVKQIIVSDMLDLSAITLEEVGAINLAFDFVATNLKEAFNGEDFYRIADVDMATKFAELAKEAGAKYICAISMKDADKPTEKKGDYAKRAKHDMEENIRAMEFKKFAIMRPDWLQRDGSLMEFIYTFGGLQGIKVSDMAKCIIWSARNQREAEYAYTVKEMKKIAKQS